MQTFQTVFEAYGGDYATTMERFMNREDMYLRILDMLFEDKSMELLEQALKEQDPRAAFEAAHTLKGVVANMGLTPLYEAVSAIVEPLRAGEIREEYPLMYQRICEEFQKVEALRETLNKAAV